MTMITITIPPSVNSAWINLPKGGRARSKKYAAWVKTAGWEIQAQRPRRIIGSYEVRIFLGKKRNAGDADNRIKAIIDLIVKQGIVEDDRRMVSVTCGWSDQVEPGKAKVIVEAINA